MQDRPSEVIGVGVSRQEFGKVFAGQCFLRRREVLRLWGRWELGKRFQEIPGLGATRGPVHRGSRLLRGLLHLYAERLFSFGGEFLGRGTQLGEPGACLPKARPIWPTLGLTDRGPGLPEQLFPRRPALRRWLAHRPAGRFSGSAILSFLRPGFKNAAQRPEDGKHHDEQYVHPFVSVFAATGQNQLSQETIHDVDTRTSCNYSFFLGLAMESRIEVSAIIFFIL